MSILRGFVLSKKEEIVTQGDTAQSGVTQDAPSSVMSIAELLGYVNRVEQKNKVLTIPWMNAPPTAMLYHNCTELSKKERITVSDCRVSRIESYNRSNSQ